jgi:LmbE family N-acetylglucosaminyl deacetylase
MSFAGLDTAPTILCIGAHCDDIEIGCGGTLVHWARQYPEAQFVWAIFASEEGRDAESRSAARQLLGPSARVDLRFPGFRASYFPAQFTAVKDAFEEIKAQVKPSLVLTHRLEDRHQDHRLLAELTWNTFRSHLVFEYEIPKYEGDLGQPNVFVPLAVSELDHKVRTLMECFPSQHPRRWFTEDTFRAMARLRGIECDSPTGFAEAFHARKVCL